MIKASILTLTLVLAGSGLAYDAEAGQERRHQGFSISTGKSMNDCSDVRLNVRDSEIVRSEQTKSIPRNSISSLQIQAPHHGGIYIQGWNRDEYSIKACLGAAGDTSAEAKALLDQLSLSVN